MTTCTIRITREDFRKSYKLLRSDKINRAACCPAACALNRYLGISNAKVYQSFITIGFGQIPINNDGTFTFPRRFDIISKSNFSPDKLYTTMKNLNHLELELAISEQELKGLVGGNREE